MGAIDMVTPRWITCIDIFGSILLEAHEAKERNIFCEFGVPGGTSNSTGPCTTTETFPNEKYLSGTTSGYYRNPHNRVSQREFRAEYRSGTDLDTKRIARMGHITSGT
jgi:hypothetical protein